MRNVHGGWKMAVCLLCACGSRSGLSLRHDGAASATADSAIGERTPDASSALLDGSLTLPDAFVARDLSPALPDAPSDLPAALPDVPRDLPPAMPDTSRDTSPTLPDASRDTSLTVPDGSRDVSSASSDASNEVRSLAPDAGASTFCSGELNHMVVNGIESYPAVSAAMIPYDCCEGGEMQAMTETFLWPIRVTWRNTDFVLPATVDLANLPKTWGVQVLVGCPSLPASCVSPPDSYASGLSGTLQVSGGIGNYDMSLCLSLADSASSPHPLVHSLELYVPHVHAGN
jgi:hypothetical protein